MGEVKKVVVKTDKFLLDFNRPLITLEGLPEEGSDLGKTIAGYIGANTEGDAYKFSSWAMAVYQGKILELDKSDFLTLKTWLKSVKMVAILKRQVLDVLDEVDK